MPTRRVKPTIAIVGASARAAAASAVRAGFQPITADLFADVDLRQIATATRISPYPDAFLDWMRAMEPPAWMYTGALENHPALVDQMAWIAPLWGNPGDVLVRVRSPHELAEVLGEGGFLFPETRDSSEGLPGDGAWLRKTYAGASGSGVADYLSDGKALDNFDDVPRDRRLYYQQRVAGVPCSAVFVGHATGAGPLGVTRQLVGESWLGARQFQYCGSIGLQRFGSQPQHEEVLSIIERIGNVLAARFNLNGLFGVDLVVDGKRVWVIEVNPRYTASVEVVERCTGIAVLALHAEANGGPQVKSVPMYHYDGLSHGKVILFADRPVTISERFAEWSLAESLEAPWPTVADVSPAGTPIEAGRPILTVFASGNDSEQVELRLRERVAAIERLVYEGES